MKSTLHHKLCPCCHGLLYSEPDGMGRHVAWCGPNSGRCASYKANDGALGATPDEAADKLWNDLMNEPDWPI